NGVMDYEKYLSDGVKIIKPSGIRKFFDVADTGAISTNIAVAMKDESQRDSALITFLATASGMHFLGLSSVFWGIVIGLTAHLILTKGSPDVSALASTPSSKS
ncbi:MAG: benzoate/H(+) symporter BenE family transporter, partial [Acinetobacter sp.]